MTIEQVETVVDVFRTGEDPDGDDGGVHTRMVPISEIEQDGFDLNIGRYIRVSVDETVDVGTALAELREAQQALRDAESAMWERLKESGYA
jgi:type I restriction enzyme M protein